MYDVTHHLPLHRWGGKDASDAVDGPQHPASMRKVLQRSARWPTSEQESELAALTHTRTTELSLNYYSSLPKR